MKANRDHMGKQSKAARSMSRRRFMKAAGALALTSAVGCNRRTSSRLTGITLEYYAMMATPEIQALYRDRLVPAFESRHPGIRVNLNMSLGDAGYDSKLLTMIAAKMPPDLFHVSLQNFPSYAAK